MSDEPGGILVVAEVTTVRVEPRRLYEHRCKHEGCREWGSFGFARRYGTVWFCGEHRADGEAQG